MDILFVVVIIIMLTEKWKQEKATEQTGYHGFQSILLNS